MQKIVTSLSAGNGLLLIDLNQPLEWSSARLRGIVRCNNDPSMERVIAFNRNQTTHTWKMAALRQDRLRQAPCKLEARNCFHDFFSPGCFLVNGATVKSLTSDSREE